MVLTHNHVGLSQNGWLPCGFPLKTQPLNGYRASKNASPYASPNSQTPQEAPSQCVQRSDPQFDGNTATRVGTGFWGEKKKKEQKKTEITHYSKMNNPGTKPSNSPCEKAMRASLLDSVRKPNIPSTETACRRMGRKPNPSRGWYQWILSRSAHFANVSYSDCAERQRQTAISG